MWAQSISRERMGTEHEDTGHTVSAIEKPIQMKAGAQTGSPAHGTVLPTPFCKHPHRHAQRYVSWMIPRPIQLTMKLTMTPRNHCGHNHCRSCQRLSGASNLVLIPSEEDRIVVWSPSMKGVDLSPRKEMCDKQTLPSSFIGTVTWGFEAYPDLGWHFFWCVTLDK